MSVPEMEGHMSSSFEAMAPMIKAWASSVEKSLFAGDAGSQLQEP